MGRHARPIRHHLLHLDKEPAPLNWSPRLSFQSTRRFDVLGFRVAETGVCNLNNTNIGGWDHFLALYLGAFDAARPDQNNIAWCDLCTPFNITLQAGGDYFGMTTGYRTEAGDYRLGIVGPSAATRLEDLAPPPEDDPPSDNPAPPHTVPEPASGLLLLAGGVLLFHRARKTPHPA